ncbi:DUF2075 domain-containing protein [Vibrio parahaemolyticus]|nr:DUF2075 domain-containing protein [Vibrio parahaemolyticus]
MAVFMVYGVPGSGKSAWTVENIVLKNLIKKERKVITNLSLNVPYLTEIKEVEPELIRIVHSEKGDFSDTFLKVEDYQDSWRNDKGQAPVIIVDEAHFSLNKQRKKDEVLEIENFFSTHRQAGYDIYLITQDYNRIPKDILGFVDTYYEVTKQRQMGKSAFTVYVRDSSRKLIGNKTRNYNKEIFKCYKSHLLSNSNVDEDHDVAGIKSMWTNWRFWGTGLIFLGLLYGFTFGGLSLNPFNFMGKEKKQVEKIDHSKVDFVSIDTQKPIEKQEIKNKEIVFEEVQEVKKEEVKEIKYLSQNHPLDNKLFQIRSYINDIALISIYDKDSKQQVSVIKSTDLEKMGYIVENYSSCSMKLTYENVNFFIDCSNIQIFESSATDKILNNVPTIK